MTGGVNNGANTASSLISDAGTGNMASGSIRTRLIRGNRARPAAIMESMPHTPDEETRNDVTRRITAHVTAGWPASASPLSATAAPTATSP